MFLPFWFMLCFVLKILFDTDGVVFAVLYLTLAAFVFTSIKLNFRFKPFELLGRNSYAIYLVHFLVLDVLQKILPLQAGLAALFIGITLTILISYFFSIISYRLLEKKIHLFVTDITTSSR